MAGCFALLAVAASIDHWGSAVILVLAAACFVLALWAFDVWQALWRGLSGLFAWTLGLLPPVKRRRTLAARPYPPTTRAGWIRRTIRTHEAEAARNASPLSDEAKLAERLANTADDVEALYDSRRVEEPRLPLLGGGVLAAVTSNPDPNGLEVYRKRTMALYYERYRTAAVTAFDEALAYGVTTPDQRTIIHQPNGTAALRLVPDVLRDAAARLINADGERRSASGAGPVHGAVESRKYRRFGFLL